MKTTNRQIVLAALAALTLNSVNATTFTFYGEDSFAYWFEKHPSSDTGASQFDAFAIQLGPMTTFGFESSPVSQDQFQTRVDIGQLASITSDYGFFTRNTPDTELASPYYGYNTTEHGAKFLEIPGGPVTISFSSPINAFGAYISGIDQRWCSITYDQHGTEQTLAVPNPLGGCQFLGFAGEDLAISSLTISAWSPDGNYVDMFSLDDIRFVTVPEPDDLLSWGIVVMMGIAGVSFWRTTHRKQP